jgi:hypothetical protein
MPFSLPAELRSASELEARAAVRPEKIVNSVLSRANTRAIAASKDVDNIVGECPNQDNADKVLGALSANQGGVPSMPPGGPYWTADQLALFGQWQKDGYQP